MLFTNGCSSLYGLGQELKVESEFWGKFSSIFGVDVFQIWLLLDEEYVAAQIRNAEP